MTELNTLLGLYNIKLEEIKGEAKGKPYHGIVYSATTDIGERIGIPVKASRIGKDVGIKKLESRRQENLDSLTPEIRTATRDQVCRAIHSTRTKDEFIRYLKDRHIDAVIRENKAGRIYGMTFIDHNTRTDGMHGETKFIHTIFYTRIITGLENYPAIQFIRKSDRNRPIHRCRTGAYRAVINFTSI